AKSFALIEPSATGSDTAAEAVAAGYTTPKPEAIIPVTRAADMSREPLCPSRLPTGVILIDTHTPDG
ncbi:hypothetical protein, partial [Streptomyces sp. NPDC000460]|uniref:hypothetical protein n=1 Tax=Streptomyces sp. NPDC000460 TaxID=3364539 RepID=UPI0036A5B917